jgi:hypothetical protein
LNPKNLIYVTGDLLVDENYNKWLTFFPQETQISVIPYAHFERNMFGTAKNNKDTLSSDDHIFFKLNHSVIDYNCLQKRPREHRVALFDKLEKQNLLGYGINSMSKIPLISPICSTRIEELNRLLPMYPPNATNPSEFDSDCSGSFLVNFNNDIVLKTYYSIISEALVSPNMCFISEKTYKVIANRHPFVIFGNPYTLRELRKQGYQTFENFFDESYDIDQDLDIKTEKVINIIKGFAVLTPKEKLNWFYHALEVCNYNWKVFYNRNSNSRHVFERLLKVVKNV